MSGANAFDTRVRTLPADAEAAVETLWRDVFVRGAGSISRDELRRVATRVAAGGRRVGFLPEQLIVAVKDSWGAHAVVRGPEQRFVARWVLTELISLAICAYYDGGAAERTRSAAPAVARVRSVEPPAGA